MEHEEEFDDRPPADWYWYGVAFESALALLALVLGWLIATPALATLHWSARDLGIGLAGCMPLLILFFYASHSSHPEFVRIGDLVRAILLPLVRERSIAATALLAAAAGFGEEMLFRGVMQGWLTESVGVAPAILVSSLVFGLLHWITPTYAVCAFIVSVYLGWLWHVNGNLLTVVTTHGVYDFLALLYLLRREQRSGMRPLG